LYTSKALLVENNILAPKGCCTPKFLLALENDQVLLAHPPLGTGVPLTIFLKGVQNWLKFHQVHTYNFVGSESGHNTLPLDVPLGWGDNVGTTFGEAPPP